MKVLIADNDIKTLDYLGDILSKEGFDVTKAKGGDIALQKYREQKPDFICLDIMMPDIDGYEVCRSIREDDTQTPIIFISAKAAPVDKITGLELGADDYIIKPFDVNEVIARIRSVARRCFKNSPSGAQDDCFSLSDIKVYPNHLHARRGDSVIDLSLRDVKLLKLLHDHKNKVVHRDTLLDYCWGAHIMPESRTVDWHISQLRKKIEIDPKHCLIIQTVHGVGYKYEE